MARDFDPDVRTARLLGEVADTMSCPECGAGADLVDDARGRMALRIVHRPQCAGTAALADRFVELPEIEDLEHVVDESLVDEVARRIQPPPPEDIP